MNLKQIREVASGTETRTIRHSFNETELAELKEEFFDNDSSLDSKQTELDIIKAEFKEAMEPMKKRTKELRIKIKNKFIDEEKEVLKVANQDSGKMEFYCVNTGVLLDERKLHPSERQTRMKLAVNED